MLNEDQSDASLKCEASDVLCKAQRSILLSLVCGGIVLFIHMISDLPKFP